MVHLGTTVFVMSWIVFLQFQIKQLRDRIDEFEKFREEEKRKNKYDNNKNGHI